MTQDLQTGAQRPQQDQAVLTPDAVVQLLVGSTVTEVERELVLQTLARCDGNRTHAARVLGVSVRTLRNKIRQYETMGLEVPDYDGHLRAHSSGSPFLACRKRVEMKMEPAPNSIGS
jgi:hypothetical protein